MSRKTKLDLWIERLEQISACPKDIFKTIEPDEKLFLTIENADKGDVCSVRELVLSLYEIYKNEEQLNAALFHYTKKGLELGDKDCARIALKLISGFNTGFELLDEVFAALEGEKKDENTERLITGVRVKRIIASATSDADYNQLTDTLSEMYDEYSAYARIYLASRRLNYTGYYDKEKVDALAAALDVPRVITLPVFAGERCNESTVSVNSVKEHSALRYALGLIDMDEWRDFWLRAIYEYSEIYLDGNLLPFTNEMLTAIDGRAEYPRKNLHKLAIKKYYLDLTGGGKSEYTALESECKFYGLEFDISGEAERDAVIKEAVYTDSKMERERHAAASMLGTEIIHAKNRYSLTATVKNHLKRGNKHMWPITLSIQTSQDTPPVMGPIRISERRHEVCRGGVTLGADRKLSQVLCRGDIVIGDKAHPFEVDLVLDISYVSSTKCEWFDVKVREYNRMGDYLVINGAISIY
ncbi:MAG: hypothetical protein IJW53_02680 [Clostridia bacterium]|nr:hypothetical protein [Clostridia bacterium]